MMKPRLFLLTCALLLGLGTAAPAHEPIKNKTPHDLDLLPPSAFFVMQLRTGDLLKRFGPSFLARLEQMGPDALETAEKEMGFPLPAVERATMMLHSGERPESVVVLTLNRPLDRTKVLDAVLKPLGFAKVGGENPPPPLRQEKQVKGRTMYVLEGQFSSQAVSFLTERMFVLGDARAVEAALEAVDRPSTSPFAVECRKLSQQNSPFLLALNMADFPPQMRREFESAPVFLPTLLQGHSCFVTATITNGLTVKATVVYPDAAQAGNAHKAFTDSLQMLRTMLPMGLKEIAHVMVEEPDAPEHFYQFLKGLDADLQKVPVTTEGNLVRAEFRHACDDKFLGGLIGDFVLGLFGTRSYATFGSVGGGLGQEVRIRPEKAAALLKIAEAFEKYRAKHGHYPPTAIYGKDGKPLLSWRVALLPYLGEEELYKQFKLDEPWYSKHNGALAKKMPQVYGITPGEHIGRTDFRMILGPGAAYDATTGVKVEDLKDGPAQTLLVVENARWNSVVWTRPEGYRFGGEWPLPRMTHGESAKGFYALFGDGTVRFVKHDVDEKTFRAMITKSGGEKLAEKDLGEVIK